MAKQAEPVRIYSYDLETTRIEAGTPELLYITGYGPDFSVSLPIVGEDKYQSLCTILETRFLQPELDRAMFIAWNANRFDAYFIAKALILSDAWIVHPYLTASKQLRGFRVKSKEKQKNRRALSFQFLDGMSITGLQGVPLGDKKDDATGKVKKGFLSVFAPDFKKLDFDHERTTFDPKNPEHVKYAERDSIGLYHGMVRVNEIVKQLTGMEIRPTIGNLAIHYLLTKLPAPDFLKRPPDNVLEILHLSVKRGGYCWAAKQYSGPVWKYDLNQAYAAAMRECELPCGDVAHTVEYVPNVPGIYHCRFSRRRKTNVPFYYKPENGIGLFTAGAEAQGWLTSIEIEHLQRDGWTVEILDGYAWSHGFNLRGMVDDLERLRGTDPEGPSGPLGTMVKAIGNNAYGKTLEQLNNVELIFAKECPDGYLFWEPTDPDMQNVFCRIRFAIDKPYHLPQIGSFITAHVRVKLREAAIKMENEFIYADTDCLVFSKPADHLEIDAKKYGAWKQEANGDLYMIVAKKVYASEKGEVKAKGLNTKHLTPEVYKEWINGKVPKQTQTQRQNFLQFIGGAAMFKDTERTGTDVKKSKTVKVVNGDFVPL